MGRGFVEAGKIKDEAQRARVLARIAARAATWRTAPQPAPQPPTEAPWCGHPAAAIRVDRHGAHVCTACAWVPEEELRALKNAP